MALLAGLGFGGFFTMLDRVEVGVFWPLVAGRVACCAVLLVFALITRRPLIPPGAPFGLLGIAGLLDAPGNLFFLLAVQSGRLDVAAVLGSLYPAVTAILARLITKEHMARLQMLGVGLAILAIVLITSVPPAPGA
jgi:drug/metabolite transporter (DMT)-like permease